MKRLLCIVTGLALAAGFARAADRDLKINPEDVVVWNPDVVKAWERVPVMDSGRVKPLFTVAKYELKQTRGLEGVRFKTTEDKTVKMSPMEWLLTTMFYPKKAESYPIFLVKDSNTLIALGMPEKPGLRWVRYTYRELHPFREQLYEKAGKAFKMEAEQRDFVQEGILDLENAVRSFEFYSHVMDFGRGIPIAQKNPHPQLADWRGKNLPVSDALQRLEAGTYWSSVSNNLKSNGAIELADQFKAVHTVMYRSKAYQAVAPMLVTDRDKIASAMEVFMGDAAESLAGEPDYALVANMAPYMIAALVSSNKVTWYAPFEAGSETWHPGSDLASMIVNKDAHADQALARLKEIEGILASGSHDALQAQAQKFAEGLSQRAESLHLSGTVRSELAYHKADLFLWAKILFILMFFVAAVSWLTPEKAWSKSLNRWSGRLLWIPWLVMVAGIVWRCTIMKRPPVTSLYETIPFITAVAVLFTMFFRIVFKDRITVAVAAVIGAAGLLLTGIQESQDAGDTMKNLEPVLRSTFWLSTHVTIISVGYAAVIVAAAFSMVYIVHRLFDLQRRRGDIAKMLTKCTYGILCFALFFSLVGTVLGGIWGNDSWGRFWGWDPKENGALLIVLWCLAVLHMRLAGWIKEFGLHICGVLGANFVVFSWRHVNQLNTGLHSYGFTSGEMSVLITIYCIITMIAAFGVVVCFLERAARKAGSPPSQGVTGRTQTA